MKDEKKHEEHHCSVIEKDRVESELADCDENSTNEADREKCRTKVKETSKKREFACKHS